MRKILIIFFILLLNLIGEELKDAKYYLDKSKMTLQNYYDVVDAQSKNFDFVKFRNNKMVSYDVYKKLSLKDINKYNIRLVLANIIIKRVEKISDFQGISVAAIIKSEINDKNPQIRYLKFNRVYYTDLNNLGEGSNIFAYCNIVYLTNCVMLGIGQKW